MRRALLRSVVVALVLAFSVAPAMALDLTAGIQAFLTGDRATAWREFRGPANQGNADAQYHVGVMYAHGFGVEQDLAAAAQWYEKAAAQKHLGAQFNLGLMLYNDGDFERAGVWLKKAANQGNATAQQLCGWMYRTGNGLPQNDVIAFLWMLRAADQGNLAAINSLGVMNVRGMGTAVDRVEGYKWFEIAATKAYPGAALNRSEVARHLSPDDVARAKRKAAAWMTAHGWS